MVSVRPTSVHPESWFLPLVRRDTTMNGSLFESTSLRGRFAHSKAKSSMELGKSAGFCIAIAMTVCFLFASASREISESCFQTGN